MDAWAKKRRSELTAAAPVKRRSKKDTFVQVPLEWLAQVTKAAASPQQVFVGVWLLHLRWKANSLRFPVPNGQLAKHGINRRSKRQALEAFARAGLLTVDRQPKKTPVVTLNL